MSDLELLAKEQNLLHQLAMMDAESRLRQLQEETKRQLDCLRDPQIQKVLNG